MELKENNKCSRKLCQSRSVETKEAIIEAGIALFAEIGYHKVNTKDIAKRAGIAIGSFYGYYSDKKALLLEIIQIYKEALLQAGKCEKSTGQCAYGFDQVINYFINQKLQVAERYPLAFHLEINHMKYRDPEVKELIQKYMEIEMSNFIDHMEAHLSTLRVNDLKMAAELIYQINDNMITAYLSSSDLRAQEALIQEYKDMIARYLFKD